MNPTEPLSRRTVLTWSGALALSALAPVAAPGWNLEALKGLACGETHDLSLGLPPGVKRGGQFRVDPLGAPLPEGLHLSATGLLTVHSSQPLRVTGVIFEYDEP